MVSQVGRGRLHELLFMGCCAAMGVFLASCATRTTFSNEILSGSVADTLTSERHVAGLVKVDGDRHVVPPPKEEETCEVRLRLLTWDHWIYSDDICIKHVGRPITIPQEIALRSAVVQETGKTFEVTARRYCDTSYPRSTTGGEHLCVWNRKFYDRYPMEFVIRSVGKTPLSSRISMVRVIRNGRSVYTWTSTNGNSNTSELRIPGDRLVVPEYFNEAVDIGLYVLSSGADQATAAAVTTAEPTVRSWRATLRTALEAMADDVTPVAIRQTMQCVKTKLEHLSALAGEIAATDDTRASYEKRATELNVEVKRLHDEAEARNTRLDAAKPFSVAVVSDDPIPSGAAPAKLGGIELKDAEIVAFFGPDGKTVTLKKFKPREPWLDFRFSDIPAPSVADQKALFTVVGGTRKGKKFSIAKPAESAEPVHGVAVMAAASEVPCALISDDLSKAHKVYVDAVSAVGADGALRRVGAVTRAATAFSGQLGLSLSQLRQHVSDSVAKLPPEVRETVENDIAWLRLVDQAFAGALSASQMIAANGADIESSVKTAIHDPQAHLRAYEAFAAALPTEDTIYTPPARNPAAGVDEARLPMTFHRPRQTYYLLAWNGVPIPLTSNSQIEVEPRLENLIPIIDIGGYHWQTGWQYIPVAGFGGGVIGTREKVKPPGEDAYTSDFVGGPQFNVSVSGFRVGLAYFVHEAEGCSTDCFGDEKNFRFLIGADLIRLVTGKDTAVVRSDAAGTDSSGDE